jgi:hypothetical protein
MAPVRRTHRAWPMVAELAGSRFARYDSGLRFVFGHLLSAGFESPESFTSYNRSAQKCLPALTKPTDRCLGTCRMRLVKSGKILIGSTEVPCTIGALSKIGACLTVDTTHEIPAMFEFMTPDRALTTCKVIWRDDKRLGVHFRPGTR